MSPRSLSVLACLGMAMCARPQPPEAPAAVPPPRVVPVEVPATPPHRLHTFFSALQAAEAGQGQVNVLHLGASHTASDTFTGPLRDALQGRFGDAGRGMSHPGSPWKWFRQESATYSQTGDWTAWRGVRRHAVGPFGVGGVRLQSDQAGDSITRGTCAGCRFGAEIDGAAIHYLAVPDGGTFQLYVDDVAVQTVSTALAPEEVAALRAEHIDTGQPEVPDDLPTPPDVGRWRQVQLALTRGAHTVRLEVVGDGPVSLTGVATTLSGPGVRYHALGINGTRADQFLGFPAQAVHDELVALSPDLVVLHWGINEMYADSLRPRPGAPVTSEARLEAASAHTATYLSMIDRVRAARPDASCLLVLPTDLTPDKHPDWEGGAPDCTARVPHPLYADLELCERAVPPTHAAVRAAQVAAAEAAGCAVWDQQAAMGGPGSYALWSQVAPRLAGDDGIHLTMAGYRMLAEGLFADLMATYEAWRADPGPHPPLPTTPVDVAGWVADHPEDRPEPAR